MLVSHGLVIGRPVVVIASSNVAIVYLPHPLFAFRIRAALPRPSVQRPTRSGAAPGDQALRWVKLYQLPESSRRIASIP